MKVVISNPPGARKTTGTGKWPTISDRELLIRTLREAAGRAAKQQRTVLASFTQPVERCDAIRAFTGARRAGLGECFFWEQPAEQNTLVGVGAATTIETNGSMCFIDAASAWRALLQDAVVTYAPAAVPTPGSGPVLFGGFAFDPLSPPTPLWAGFPGGLLILPRFLLSYSANYVTLTINRMVRASDTIEQSTQEIEADVRHLQAAIEHAPTIPREKTASRGETEEEDAQLGTELLQCEKNKSEHAIVVAMMREALQHHCTTMHISAAPQLLKLKNVQHLKTPIAGELIPGRCILDVIADLHPTPAVGGFPRHAALEAIRNVEKLDRGWYAGPLGWIGSSGHGEVAVALRSGLSGGAKATLFAGCGIVSGSDPQAEYVESCLKFQVMLRGLGASN